MKPKLKSSNGKKTRNPTPWPDRSLRLHTGQDSNQHPTTRLPPRVGHSIRVNLSFPTSTHSQLPNMTPYLFLVVFAVATNIPTTTTALDVPRVTPAQLDKSKLLQSGKVPFILTQSMEDWESRTKFNDLDWFAEHFPDAIVDYYPENLATVDKKPFLRKMSSVLNEFSVPNPKPAGGWSQNGRSEKARYIHWRMTAAQWNKVQHLLTPMHSFFTTDKPWMKQCIPTKALRDEFHVKTLWKTMLLGTRGAGMFNHSDNLLSSSWFAHVQGQRGKWWYICGQGRGPGPYEGEEQCFEDLVMPGEILFNPKQHHHETQNVGTLTLNVKGQVVSAFNYRSVATQLHRECAYSHLNFDLSGPLCDALDNCFLLWHQAFSGEKNRKKVVKEGRRLWPKWRSLANPTLQTRRDAPSALGNNYDGRIYSKWG